MLCLNVSACCKLWVMVSSILSQMVSLLSNSSTIRCCILIEHNGNSICLILLKWSLSAGQYLKELKDIIVVVTSTCA